MANLERFIEAQANTYDSALEEIKNGKKTGHWIWFIFPQIAGLGMSSTSQYYAIADFAEAKAYLSNNVLRSRLIEISEALLQCKTSDPNAVLGYVDALKVKSSMTLFHRVDPSCELFTKILEKFYDGEEDWKTLSILGIEK